MSAKEKNKLPKYTLLEEIFNGITHGVGAVLSIAGLVVLVVLAVMQGDVFKVVSSAIYGTCLVILFMMSTMYHSITNKTAKSVLRVFDHNSIFLLIAGSYTPITLVTLREYSSGWGWSIFGAVWGLSILGIVFKSISLEKYKALGMIIYIATGWCVFIAAVPLKAAMRPMGIFLLVLGGIAYMGGLFFFTSKKKFMHSIWHLFVIAGAIAHYFCIMFFIILA